MDKATLRQKLATGAAGDRTSLASGLRALQGGEGFTTYAGDPNGNVTPEFKGEHLLDTTNNVYYRSTGLTNADWAVLGAAGMSFEELQSINTSGLCTFFDDFLGDVASDPIKIAVGTSTQGSIAVVTGTGASLSGTLKMVTGDSNTTTIAANGVQLDLGALNFKANQGNLSFETNVKIDTVTGVVFFAGFTNQVASLQMPIQGVVGGPALNVTRNAADAVGFLLDANITSSALNLLGVGVANNTLVTAQDLGTSLQNNSFKRLGVRITAAGAATFFINGSKVGTTVASAVTATTALTPVVVAYQRGTASRTIEVDYIRAQQNR